MGEYAKTIDGRDIKIGTCESMYYLRADQVPQLATSDVDGHWDAVRFRFPFPDEDSVPAGNFENYERRYRLNLRVADVCPLDPGQHYAIQFRAESHGYLCSIPCPEANGTADDGMGCTVNGLKVHRNGFAGSVFLVQQRVWDGKLVAVFQCACGIAWRAETLEQAEPYIVALRSEADRLQGDLNRAALRDSKDYGQEAGAKMRHELADRITAGYTNPPAWVVAFCERKAVSAR